MWKRVFDKVVSAIALFCLWPLMVVLAVWIKVGSKGAAIYRGTRIGLNGKPFQICKFRSMVTDAERLGGPSTSNNDCRITHAGRILRKYKLDELPQLLNVFRGEMSFVGPRPEVQKYTDMYTAEEQILFHLRPGITDWASIWNSDEGSVLAQSDDPDRAYEEFIRPTKLQLQLAYARHHSLWIDLKIIFCTLYKLFNKHFVPREIRTVLATTGASDLRGMGVGNASTPNYSTVTELPGHGATQEQYSMLQTRYQLAARLAGGKDVLELACGPGIGLGYLSRSANRVVGGDFDPALVKAALKHYGSRVEVRQLDAEQLPFGDESFDVILLLEAIYYLPTPEKFIAEASRVLRKDGQVLICSANPERPDFNPSPFAKGYYTAAELSNLLTKSGFTVELFAGYPVTSKGFRERFHGAIRLVAVKLRLIPRTMSWKIRFKRLLFGKLSAIPAELDVCDDECAPIVSIDASTPVREFKVIYAIGRRAA